jgi:hypothetical protein
MTRSTTSILLTLSAVALAACGSSTGADPVPSASVATSLATATTPATTTQTTATTTTPARTTTQRNATPPVAASATAARPPAVRLRQQVRVVRPGAKPGPFAGQARARPGDLVQLRTIVLDRRPPKGARLRISIEAGPSARLRVRTGPAVGAPSAVIEIRARDKRRLRVATVRYSCVIGAPTFCPVQAGRTPNRFRAIMAVPPRKAPVVLVVTLAP